MKYTVHIEYEVEAKTPQFALEEFLSDRRAYGPTSIYMEDDDGERWDIGEDHELVPRDAVTVESYKEKYGKT